MTQNSVELKDDFITQVFQKDKYSLAKFISILESTYLTEPDAFYEVFQKVIDYANHNHIKEGFLLSFTGTPGVGKSSLIHQLINTIRNQYTYSMAILAIDPTSSISKGSLLGDRTRFRLPTRDNNIYFRSQASNLYLGGLSNITFPIALLLLYIFDLVIIETVGVGQNEIESHILADHTFLVLQPLSGDEIQFLKAGIMEVPNTFIVNKCDEVNISEQVKQSLKNSLQALNIQKNIFTCSALYNQGFDQINSFIHSLINQQSSIKETQTRDEYFFNKLILEEYGKSGLKVLHKEGLQFLPDVHFIENYKAAFKYLKKLHNE